ncbi:MAG: hypothetical protein MI739_09770 [Bacteroidales bacterium]|nr:hypothetical protein [Bacteroidales bacterium]
MKKILIITTSHDNECIDMVSDELKKQNALPIRFNSDQYPSEISLSCSYRNKRWEFCMHQNGERIDLTDIHAIWYRRLNVAGKLNDIIEEKYFNASKEESRRTLLGIMSTMDTFILDYTWKVRYADFKLRQLKVASELGLEIPETLFTNNEKETVGFYNNINRDMITKMQTSFAIYEKGIENVVFTNKITDKEIDNLTGLQYCPMTFQKSIEKKVELRVTVVGKKIFTAAINPNNNENAKNDWRKEGVNLIDKWEKYELPESVSEKIFKLMDYYQLNYGAIDIIVTNDDRYVFLEINPVGEFFWLDKIPDFDISKEIANVLLNPELRRDNRHPKKAIVCSE